MSIQETYKQAQDTRPSALILAMKRSGTNWTHDTLSPYYVSNVNEPLGLHNDVDPANPLNPWNYSSKNDGSVEFGHKKLDRDPYASLLARDLVGWLKEGNKLIKETDFLYGGWLLDSAPLQTVVLKRDPRDSIASYKKHDLYKKWRFEDKMTRFRSTIKSTPELDNLYGIFLNGEKEPHQQLALYYAIGFLEIDRITKDHSVIKTHYEELVMDPLKTFEEMFAFLGLPWTENAIQRINLRMTSTRDPGAHGTFRATDDLTSFTSVLSKNEENDIRAIFKTAGLPLERVDILTDNKYVASERTTETGKLGKIDREEDIGSALENTVYKNGLHISKTLVTNREYARFLVWLSKRDFPLTIKGIPLFYNDRPEGSIRSINGKIYVEKSQMDYPVNFVNWVGAATYSLWIGGRLPTVNEWENVICPKEVTVFKKTGKIENPSNIAQYLSGPTPVTYFPPNKDGIYDAVGNASIWTQDGTDFEKQKAGPAWNHTKERSFMPSLRPFWLGTSGLGIRTVFSGLYLPEDTYTTKLREIVDFLVAEEHQDFKKANQELFEKFEKLFYEN